MQQRRTLVVVLVDDHGLIGEAVADTLAGDPQVHFSGTVPTVALALALVPGADVVILDLRLADGSSPTANIAEVLQAGRKVVVYTSGEDAFALRNIARAGATAIIRKSQPLSALLDAVRACASDTASISTEWAAAADADPLLAEARLSSQEGRVLALVASGHKTTSVAALLGLSAATVDDYIRRIRGKYALSGRPAETRVDLLKRAVEDGYIVKPAREHRA